MALCRLNIAYAQWADSVIKFRVMIWAKADDVPDDIWSVMGFAEWPDVVSFRVP